MPNLQDDSVDTDDALSRLMRDGASPRELFYGLTAQGVPPQQAMTAAYARDSDVVRAALQAYGRPTAIPNAPLSSLNESPVIDTRLPPADLSRGQVVQPVSVRSASVFPDPPPMAPPSGADDVLRRRPGFNPLPDGSTGLDPSYLAPRREAQRRSGWGSRVVLDTRESVGLPQDGGGNFAGVDLSKNGAGDYGLDPHYAAQLRAALDAPPYVPSEREQIVRGGKFSAGAAPFGFAGPGSLNFDPSLESNTETLAPFRRSLEDFQAAPPVPRSPRAGDYVGAVRGFPLPRSKVGPGAGVYVDDSGHIYPQFYFGSPGVSGSVGHSDDLDSQLTGLSATGSINKVDGRRIPGAGILYGIGPYEMPWLAKIIKDHLP